MKTTELNKIMGKGLEILEKFCEYKTKRDEDYFDMLDYLQEMAYNYYLSMLDNGDEVTEKSVLNCFYHACNTLKIRHGALNNRRRVDNSVTEKNKIGGEKDNGKYKREIMSKYKVEHTSYLSYQTIAITYTNKSLRNAVLHGCIFLGVTEVEGASLTSGLTPEDAFIKNEESKKVMEVLKPIFADSLFDRFERILNSTLAMSNSDRQFKNRFMGKYPFFKTLTTEEIVYLFNTYKNYKIA